MLTRTKLLIAGIATLALLGTAVVAAQEITTGPSADLAKGYQGKDVSFSYDAADGTLRDYAVGGSTLFDSVSLARYNASDVDAFEHGRMLVAADGDLARVVVFDAKNAAFRLASPAGNTVTLVVPPGVGIESQAGDKGWSAEGVILHYANNVTGRLELRGDGSVNVTGQTITVTLGAQSHVQFRLMGHSWEVAKERIAMMKLHKHLKEKKEKKEKHEKKEKRAKQNAKPS